MRDLHTRERTRWIRHQGRHRSRLRALMLYSLAVAVLFVGWCEW